jgi:hypothetical protein
MNAKQTHSLQERDFFLADFPFSSPGQSRQVYMSNESLYLIGELPGFTPQLGRLVSMMNYVRSTTLSAVAGSGIAELDYLHDTRSNSIGALLSHIAATEVGYQAATFHARELNTSEKQEWAAAIELGDRARREIQGRELNYYLERLEQVRSTTLMELGRRNDQWLQETTSFSTGLKVNNHFKWFHVLGHELNHRGQIHWLRKRTPRS